MTKKRLIAMMNEASDSDKPVIVKINRFDNDTELIETEYINISEVQINNNEIQIIGDL